MRSHWRVGIYLLICVIGVIVLFPSMGRAIPSFTQQTGFTCTVCHTAFPQLTPIGREFKLNGYVLSNEQSKLPPLSAMLQPSFTNTDRGQSGGAAPGFNDNNNVALTQASLFYAGRLFGPYAEKLFDNETASLVNKIGVFLQGTYDGIGKAWSWDNWELRFADRGFIHSINIDYGVYLNNNPTLQDLWNTTPAWGFPFSKSRLAPTPTASTLLGGTVSQQVAGIGAYARFFNTLYFDLGSYRTLSADFQNALGVNPSGETQVTNLAPYWRIAAERALGSHHIEIGTYGLAADTFPGRDRSAGKDHIMDIGIDSQYQYLSGPHDVTLLLNWIHERQVWDASQVLGVASNSSDKLWEFSATTSYLFKKTWGANAQYFIIDGDSDTLLYPNSRTGSPTSDGWIFQLDYLPFNKRGGPAFWPASSVEFSLQYVLYNRFDGSRNNFGGTGRNASDNNTIYLQVWITF